MECACCHCETNRQLYPQTATTFMPFDPVGLEKKIEILSQRIATYSLHSASASYAIFYYTFKERLRANSKLADRMTNAFLLDRETEASSSTSQEPFTPRNKTEAVFCIVSQSMREDSKTTFPTFLPIFKEMLLSDSCLINGLWDGIYCGTVKAIALDLMQDEVAQSRFYRLFTSTIPTTEDIPAIRGMQQRLLDAYGEGMDESTGPVDTDRNSCSDTLAWAATEAGKKGLNAIQQCVADRLTIPFELAIP